MNFSVTKNGVELSSELYNWDEKTKTFSTNENDLVLDFSGINGLTFKTGSYCTFKTGPGCTFKTYSYCTFDAGSDCTFKTGSDCTFDTGSNCVVIRRDIFEVIKLNKGKQIKLNGSKISGFEEIEPKKKLLLLTGKKLKFQ
jgi:hypothetical protein